MKIKIRLFSTCLLLIAAISVYAQKSALNPAAYSFANGEVICSDNGTPKGNLYTAQSPYDPQIIGVWLKQEFIPNSTGEPQRIPETDIVKSDGNTYVKFSDSNGAIKKGDPVTSSNIPGVAIKATDPGMILGIALEDALDPSGLVKIRVMIQYMR